MSIKAEQCTRFLFWAILSFFTLQTLVSCKAEESTSAGQEEISQEEAVGNQDSFNPVLGEDLLDSDDPLQAYNQTQLAQSLRLDVLGECLAQNLAHKPEEASCLSGFQVSAVSCEPDSIHSHLQSEYFYAGFKDLVEPFFSEDLAAGDRYEPYGCYEKADQSEFLVYILQATLATELGGQVSYQFQEIRITK